MLSSHSPLLTILLGAMAALGPLSMDIYLVSMPSMTEALGATVGEVQLTLSVYMLGFGLAQLVYGPMSDRFGRKPTLIVGLVLYIVSSAAAALAPGVAMLIVARFFQAFGTCSAVVVSRAIVRDLHSHERAARIYAYMQIVMGIAPLAAPIVGSHLHVVFGWQANFVLVATYGALLLLAVVLQYEETNLRRDPAAISPRTYARNIALLMASRTYLGYVLTIGCMGGGLFAFLSGSPYVLLRVFGFPEASFGYLFGLCMLGNLVGAAISGRLVTRVGIDRLLTWGLGLAIVAGGAMTGLTLARVDHVAAVLLPMFLFMMAFQFIMPQALAGAMSPFPHIAGYASSMLGLLQFGLPALVGVGVAAAFDGTARPMAGAILVMALLATAAYGLVVPSRTASKSEN